jgi:hypothetical protein
MTRRKTGSGQAVSEDGEGPAAPGVDRSRNETAAQARHILEADSHSDLRRFLDGEVERTASGFNATTEARRMFVPFSFADDAAEALTVTKMHGLVAEKLNRMPADMAWVLYLTTLPPPAEEN